MIHWDIKINSTEQNNNIEIKFIRFLCGTTFIYEIKKNEIFYFQIIFSLFCDCIITIYKILFIKYYLNIIYIYIYKFYKI